jgi:broad-specificity NMP kinase
MTDAVLLTGTVGAGKTTTMHALGALLAERGIAHALVDADAVRLLHPASPDDPFQQALELAVLVVAAVVEHVDDVPRYADALGARDLLVVRLTVDAHSGEARLRSRHADDPDGLAWHRARAPELAAILARAELGGATVDTTSRTTAEVAALVAAHAGW